LRCREVRIVKGGPSHDGIREVGVSQRGGIEVGTAEVGTGLGWHR